MSGSNQVFAYSSQQDYVTPYNIVDRGPNELFIYGGGYGDNPAASGSFVARVEPGTFNEVWRRVLINTNATGEWDYPGVLNVLADGTLVVIYGYHIAKLDPATGDVLAPGDAAHRQRPHRATPPTTATTRSRTGRSSPRRSTARRAAPSRASPRSSTAPTRPTCRRR